MTECQTHMNGNYLAFFGDKGVGASGHPWCARVWDTPNERAAFFDGYGAKFRDFVDGTSNSMVIGEHLTGVPNAQNPIDR